MVKDGKRFKGFKCKNLQRIWKKPEKNFIDIDLAERGRSQTISSQQSQKTLLENDWIFTTHVLTLRLSCDYTLYIHFFSVHYQFQIPIWVKPIRFLSLCSILNKSFCRYEIYYTYDNSGLRIVCCLFISEWSKFYVRQWRYDAADHPIIISIMSWSFRRMYVGIYLRS